MSNSRRIAKNTLMLYFRQILIMLVSLYTVRVVLSVLGAEDYGIYNVVAGVVTMFGFLSGAMATASQRYFSFDLGRGDEAHLATTFSVTFQIYVLLALVIVILAETAGLWFVNHKLVIPHERIVAANWIYQAAIFSFLLTLITTPYMASIIAHENMNVYAYVSIVEAALKLAIVFLLRVLPYDKLIVYGLLLSAVAFINTALYRVYCHKHYAECRFRFVRDCALFKEIVSYSGWNLFGASVGVVKNQILNILLNLYFGPVVNAARGIASQVNGAVTSFGANFSTAMRPQVIKSYAARKIDECMSLVYRGCKMTFFLMWIFALPLCVEMETVLRLWLKNPPENTVLFTRLVMIDALIDSVSYQIMTLAQATGKIRMYQGVVGGILLMNLPVSYIALRLGSPAWGVFAVSIAVTAVAAAVRLLIVRHLAGLSVRRFLANVIFPCALVVLFSALVPCAVFFFMESGFVRFLLTVFASVTCIGLSVCFVGLNKNERSAVFAGIKDRIGGGR